MKVSICIPTYEMHGFGEQFLKQSFYYLKQQTYKNFNIIVSDHCNNDTIRDCCLEEKELDVQYYKNLKNVGSSSANLNNAIKKADGDIVKVLFQDDLMYNSSCLDLIVEHFKNMSHYWLVTGCGHFSTDSIYNKMVPKYNDNIHMGYNTISSPSVLAFRNIDPLEFDENLLWLMDVEYYKRLYNKYGHPMIIPDMLILNRLWEGQISNTSISQKLKDEELAYIESKNL